MRTHLRFFCLLFSCVLLLGLFSVSSFALEEQAPEEMTIDGMAVDPYVPTLYSREVEGLKAVVSSTSSVSSLANIKKVVSWGSGLATTGVISSFPYTNTVTNNSVAWADGLYVNLSAYNEYTTKINAPVGSTLNISFSKITMSLALKNSSGATVKTKEISYSDFVVSSIRVAYADGSYDLFTDINCVKDASTGFSFSYTYKEVPKEVYQIVFNGWIDVDALFPGYDNTYKVQPTIGGSGMKLTVDIEESTNSLLDKIVGWLSNIKDAITNLPQLIADGIKGLFIPNEETMVEIKNSWDTLLEERFGAIYQAGSILTEFAENFTYKGEKNTIEVPATTFDFGEVDFVFGGWTVELVPQKLEFLVDLLKGVIGITFTLFFVGAMKRKYDKIVGAEE